MKNVHLNRYAGAIVSVVLAVGLWLFWAVAYPHALSYQEQYQLFLWTGDYLCERLSVPGGLADWLGEMVVQFYYWPWLGGALLACLLVIVQRLSARLFSQAATPLPYRSSHSLTPIVVLSLLIPILLVWLMGDVSVLLSYVVALIFTLGAATIAERFFPRKLAFLLPLDGAMTIGLYWFAGPMAWLYVMLRVVMHGWRNLWLLLLLPVTILLFWHTLLVQWPLQMAILSICYYRVPMQFPTLLWLIPMIIALIAATLRLLSRYANCHAKAVRQQERLLYVVATIAIAVAGWQGNVHGFNRDVYELIWQDWKIRNEQWDDIIKRAEQYQVCTTFWSNSVNLALSQKRQLAEHMFDFYQSGTDALAMARMRDLTSNLPTAEAYWRLGLVNSAQRYMFDIQESILNGKKSGRCTKRIVECMIVNGHYDVALKHLALLRHSLVYRGWAQEAERCLRQLPDKREAAINAHPVYGHLRQIRFKENFLFSYAEIDKIFGLLFMNNKENKMALDYFLGQLLLKVDVQGLTQYMPWAQQWGGYSYMPVGYQDAYTCIQSRGQKATKYGEYVQRHMRSEKQ